MSQRSFTILIVDDNDVNREILASYLATEGFKLEVAADGASALQLARSKSVDLVLLDVMMPELDGFEVLEQLRAKASPDELPVIMATSKDESEDIVRAFDLGANDYVTKPINMHVLLARIQIQLRSRVSHRPTEPEAGPPPRPQPAADGAVPEGAVLEGRFLVEGEIGQGSCGTVYRGRHLGLDRLVALKVLTAAAGVTSEKRLRREGISACRVEHPNAVEVLDFCVPENGIPFLVMELLEGRTLDQELIADGPLTPHRCGEILKPTCEVLAEAHSKGVIHRDVKPQNIFLHRGRQREVVKVLDFGIAKIVGETVLSQRLTLEGSLVGTPAYMAPERLADAVYDGRADVYSLGVMLYEMLTGHRPFASSDLLELIKMHVHQEPRPLRALRPILSARIESVVLGALAKDPRVRPTAEELSEGFMEALAEEPAEADPVRSGGGGQESSGGGSSSRLTATEEWVATVVETGKGREG